MLSALGFQILQETSVPVSFGDDEGAATALENGVVVVDRSHWGRLRISGDDRLRFLHGQSTADFLSLQPGTGCRTVSSVVTTAQENLHACCKMEQAWH
jgi:glycine cleavage system aminomethyltransferase T